MRTCIVLALLASISTARPADACSPPPCWAGSFVPADGATIPANAPALYWRPSTGQAPATAKLTVAGTGATVPFSQVADGQSVVITLSEPLVPGTQYVLEETNECQYQQPVRSTFTAGATAPLPTTLGTTQHEASQRGNVTIATAGGSCSLDVDAAHATITLAHSADATPWKDLLLYETLVDGQRWAPSTAINVTTPVGGSWRGRGRDQLYRVCVDNHGEGQGLAEGTHQAAFRARLPGSTTNLTTPEVAVETVCATPPTGSNGSDDPNGSNDPSTPKDNAGCCSTSSSSASNIVWVALLALLVRRRSRR